ncbi:MAG: phage tail protein [Oscillospiraceae bacterium]|jgi:phage tail-like protein|nr:phage tail protein [Oscillospiraceae bacterium]
MIGQSDTLRPSGFMNANNFFVTFDASPLSFSKVTNLEETIEYETIQEGGLNQEVHVVPKPNTRVGTATFEKAVHDDDKIFFDLLVTAGSQFNMITVSILEGSMPRKLYLLSNCFVTKFSLSELDAAASSLLLLRLEVVYGKMIPAAANLLASSLVQLGLGLGLL